MAKPKMQNDQPGAAIMRSESVQINLTRADIEAGARVIAASMLAAAGYSDDEAQATAAASSFSWHVEAGDDFDSSARIVGASLAHTRPLPAVVETTKLLG